MAQQAYMTETDGGGSDPERRENRIRRLFDRAVSGWRGDRRIWRRGLVTAAVALLLSAVMAAHSHIPNAIGNLGSLTETFLPWFGLLIPVLLVIALVRKSATALIALVVPVSVWLNLFGGLLFDKTGSGGDLTVATHNVNADNADPAGTARAVAAAGADVMALEELKASAVPTYEKALAAKYPHHAVVGTVGLWSKYPISGVKPVDIELGWKRAMRATVTTPSGPIAVYVAHLPSVRVKLEAGFTARQRDKSADALGEAISHERLPRKILLGDLNGTMNDRSLTAITSQLRSRRAPWATASASAGRPPSRWPASTRSWSPAWNR